MIVVRLLKLLNEFLENNMTSNNNLNVEKNKAEVSKNIPELRFQGFIDAWELRKLKDFTIKTGKENSEGEDYPAYSVSNKLGLVSQTKQFDGSRLDFLDKTAYKFVNQGEFAYNPARINVGSIAFNDLGKTVIVSSLYVVLKISDKLDNEYILQFIKSIKFIEEVKRNTEGSVREYLFFDNFKNIKFPYIKNLEEQQKIGSFFKQLDNTITLHQRKLDKLKRLKQGYLQQLFPKNDEKVPRVRFTNFEYEWELRKLGDYSKYRRGSFPQPYGNKEWYDGEGAMPFVQVVDVTSKLTLVENTKQKISKLAQPKSVFVPEGKVIVTLQGSIGRVAITQYESFVDRTLLIFDDYEKATDQRFWAYTIQKKFEIEKLKAPGGTIKTITKEALSSFNVHLPQFEEQQKIGSFFNQLDNTIALQQSKLDKLKSIKQSLLQKMFI
ncbi:restriction endonuclease subunit S [Lactococcus lactis subsp. lactis]|uniref:Restriction endonuclease subunit S n=2 Tax=Lactococcus lactis TaxID=1358 RepID=A0A2Z3KLY0_LACLL|nr:restriction endonuclease subunit S [Lactococcus lactis subsp. lactis]